MSCNPLRMFSTISSLLSVDLRLYSKDNSVLNRLPNSSQKKFSLRDYERTFEQDPAEKTWACL